MKKNFLTLVALVPALPLFANPFTKSGPEPIYSGRVLPFIRDWSYALQEAISRYVRLMRGEGGWIYGLAAFGIAVLFGMVHIAGPGHGKIFTISYFGSRRASLREGLLLSAMINITDSLSAGGIVFIAYAVLRVSLGAFQADIGRILQLVSYSAIVILGVFHLLSHLRHHHHDHGDSTKDDAGRRGMRPWMLALAVGLVPCPVSTVILVYGLANGILGFAVLLVLGVSLGGMIVMSILSLSIISGKAGLVRVLEGNRGEIILTILEFFTSGMVIVFGLVLFLGVL